MFASLRTRLLTSYLLLLVVTLGGIGLALLVTTAAQPAPPGPTYERLAALARGLNLSDLLLNFARNRPSPSDLRSLTEADLLDTFADTRDVRVMVINLNRNLVLYDSAAEFELADPIRLDSDDYRLSRPGAILADNIRFGFGSFDDATGEWLYSAIITRQPRPRSPGGGGNGEGATELETMILVSELRPTQSLRSTLAEFNPELVTPLIQAGAIGTLIAIVMAYWISRTIAKPLQAVGKAANAVAEGDLNQQVPVSGPMEVRDVAEAFNLMSAEVRATQQAQRHFMANVSHDLKTPLTSIQGYSQAIMDGAARDPIRAANIIHDEASRLTRMVTELTDLARMEAGQLSMQMTPLDLGELAMNVAQRLRVTAEQQGVNLIARATPMPDIEGDGDRLVQVLDNLISNALKFTPKGGSIRVATRAVPDGVELSVADTGAGIPKDDLPRIFERFYQVDKARGPQRGTGLGLAITYEIINAHGGRISVQSTEGKGTTFTIWLPLHRSKHATTTRPIIKPEAL
jgi:signal transduction histidine kinase